MSKNKVTSNKLAAYKIALLYACFSLLWILFSDRIVYLLVHTPESVTKIQTLKGFFFVFISTLIIFFLIRSELNKRKKVFDSLRKSEERLRLTTDNMPKSYVYQYSRDAHGQPQFLFVSSGVERVHPGIKSEDVLKDAAVLFDITDPEQVAQYLEKEADSARQMSAVSMDLRVRVKDNDFKWIHVQSKPRRDDGGRVIWDGAAIDITERIQSEEKQRLMARMLDVAPNSITIHDDEGRLLYANQKTFEMHGYEKNEYMKFNLHDLDVPESEKLIEERIKKIEAEGEATLDVEHFKKDGSIIPLKVYVKSVEWEGKPAVLSIATDITERKQAEIEKEKLEMQLHQAHKMEAVGRLAGGVAHDFNNMLSVIIGNTEFAMDRAASDDQLRDALQEILNAATHSAEITQQLLAFARKQTISPKVLDLNKTVESILTMLRRLIGEDIDLIWQPAADVPLINMDPMQINQILANLCVNSRDAITDVGRIKIETGIATFDEADCAEHPGSVPGDYSLLVVSDNGCGMDRQTMENLFEPFFTTKDMAKGTGLGMATVYGIVQQNNGFINVYSKPDQGTTCKIYLPGHKIAADQTDVEEQITTEARGHETILLVEDEPAILKMATMMLERLGYNVLAAGTPDQAMELARMHNGEIHLLMTDVVMPKMNGRDLARELLSIYPTLKHLFMSGYTANVIAHHGILDEGIHFIQKPFTAKKLAVKLREVLDDTKS